MRWQRIGVSRKRVGGHLTRPLAVLLTGLVAVCVAGCQQEDSQAMSVTVHNDTASRVEIHQCTGAPKCGAVAERHQLDPGKSVSVNTSDEGVDNWWYVTAVGSKSPTSCFDLSYLAYQGQAQRNLSSDRRCPASLW